MIVGIEGNLGNGKSATMARMAIHYNALCTECNGIIKHADVIPILFDEFEVHDCTCEKPSPYKIHANFWINGIPDVHYVTCIEDIDKIYKGVFFADEFWSWIDSRGSGFNDINLVVTSIMLNSRKRGYNIVYESKLIHMTDRRVRELTDYVLRPNKYIDIGGELTKIEQHMLYPINMAPYKDKTYIVVDELSGQELNEVESNLFQFKLSDVADKYDTKQEIKKLSMGEKSPGIEKGIALEKEIEKIALKDGAREEEIVRAANSRGIDLKIDSSDKKAALDSVSLIKPRKNKKASYKPAIDIRNKDISGFIDAAKTYGLKPYFAFFYNGKLYKEPMLKKYIGKSQITCKNITLFAQENKECQ